eukprot:TRINITY_DN6411_c0_g1_i1.p1 TRINITY_DN6411_c0_g1~~TRINITY_DN6411_c0_g1_i1.p1  ORF type:complete len:592 (+),score=235.85 TRINITY_DN6411_c0_g1_i1:45-1778(+)
MPAPMDTPDRMPPGPPDAVDAVSRCRAGLIALHTELSSTKMVPARCNAAKMTVRAAICRQLTPLVNGWLEELRRIDSLGSDFDAATQRAVNCTSARDCSLARAQAEEIAGLIDAAEHRPLASAAVAAAPAPPPSLPPAARSPGAVAAAFYANRHARGLVRASPPRQASPKRAAHAAGFCAAVSQRDKYPGGTVAKGPRCLPSQSRLGSAEHPGPPPVLSATRTGLTVTLPRSRCRDGRSVSPPTLPRRRRRSLSTDRDGRPQRRSLSTDRDGRPRPRSGSRGRRPHVRSASPPPRGVAYDEPRAQPESPYKVARYSAGVGGRDQEFILSLLRSLALDQHVSAFREMDLLSFYSLSEEELVVLGLPPAACGALHAAISHIRRIADAQQQQQQQQHSPERSAGSGLYALSSTGDWRTELSPVYSPGRHRSSSARRHAGPRCSPPRRRRGSPPPPSPPTTPPRSHLSPPPTAPSTVPPAVAPMPSHRALAVGTPLPDSAPPSCAPPSCAASSALPIRDPTAAQFHAVPSQRALAANAVLPSHDSLSSSAVSVPVPVQRIQSTRQRAVEQSLPATPASSML